MKFSIITICFNEENRISETLNSIYNQEFSDFEHIIEDGGSEDKTLNIVHSYQMKHAEKNIRVFSEKDNGLYDAMNRAVKRAKGEYICFINSGDFLFDKTILSKVAKEIDKNPQMDWYYGECIVVYPNGDEYIQMPTTIENIHGTEMRSYLETNQLKLIHQSIFAKKECLEMFPFDTSYKLRAELKWYYDCMLDGIKIKRMLFPVCMYSQGGISEHVSSVAIHAKETKRIFLELGLLTEDNKKEIPNENDYRECFKGIYSQWLSLKQAGYSMEQYLLNNGIKTIAIYGYAEFGTHVINELKDSTIQIKCIIDKQEKYPYSGINVVMPERFTQKVDLIIVTALAHYKEIYEDMSSRTDCKICSLENILEEMWLCKK